MIALLLAATLLQTPASTPPKTITMTKSATDGSRTLEKGDQSNIDDGKQVLVRTGAEWVKLWQHQKRRHG